MYCAYASFTPVHLAHPSLPSVTTCPPMPLTADLTPPHEFLIPFHSGSVPPLSNSLDTPLPFGRYLSNLDVTNPLGPIVTVIAGHSTRSFTLRRPDQSFPPRHQTSPPSKRSHSTPIVRPSVDTSLIYRVSKLFLLRCSFSPCSRMVPQLKCPRQDMT